MDLLGVRDRADARGPDARQAGEALGDLVYAVDDLEGLLAEGAADDAVNAGFAAVFDGITRARCMAADAASDAQAHCQAAELDELPLKTAARAWSSIEYLRREARDGLMDAWRAAYFALSEIRELEAEGAFT